MTLPFTLDARRATPRGSRSRAARRCELELGRYSEWVRAVLPARPGRQGAGASRSFYLISTAPDVEPLHDADPHRPGAPGDADQPPGRLRDLPGEEAGPVRDARAGRGHLGAQRARRSTRRPSSSRRCGFCDERERMFFDALAQTKKGLVTTVFDTTDRVQHMFYRYLDPTHPANAGKDTDEWRGRDRAGLRAHGRAARQGLHLSRRPGHRVHGDQRPRLHELPPRREPEHLAARQRLPRAEGRRTRYERRLVRGRRLVADARLRARAHRHLHQPQGPRDARHRRARATSTGARATSSPRSSRQLVDPADGQRCDAQGARHAVAASFDGPYRFDAPDLLIGYEGGYRNSWECATGAVTERRLHRQHEELVGRPLRRSRASCRACFFCNRAIARRDAAPRSTSRPTVLGSSARSARRYMQGEMIFAEPGRRRGRGPARSGAAAPVRRGARARASIAQNGRGVRARARARSRLLALAALAAAALAACAARAPDRRPPASSSLGVDGMDPEILERLMDEGQHAALRARSPQRGRLPARSAPRTRRRARWPGRTSSPASTRAATASSTSSTATRRPTRRSPRRRRRPASPAAALRALRLRDSRSAAERRATTAAARRSGTCSTRRRRRRGVPHARATTRARRARRRCSRAWARSTCAAATARTPGSPTGRSRRDDPKGDIQLVTRAGPRPRRRAGHRARRRCKGPPDVFHLAARRRSPAPSDYLTAPRHDPASTPRPTPRWSRSAASARCCREGEWTDWLERRASTRLPMGVMPLQGIGALLREGAAARLRALRLAGEHLAREPGAGDHEPRRTSSTSSRAALGHFYTQGMPEETNALKDGVFDDDDYLEQVALVQQDTRRDARPRARRASTPGDATFVYLSDIDLQCHMLWRHGDPKYPERAAASGAATRRVAARARARHRGLLPRRRRDARRACASGCPPDTLLIVMSDHGFQPYTPQGAPERLAARPRLPGAEGRQAHRPRSRRGDVDWSKTRAYGIGFNGALPEPRRAARREGSVPPARGRRGRGRARRAQLEALRDPRTARRVVPHVVSAAARRSTARASPRPRTWSSATTSGYGVLGPVDARRDHARTCSRTTRRAGPATT